MNNLKLSYCRYKCKHNRNIGVKSLFEEIPVIFTFVSGAALKSCLRLPVFGNTDYSYPTANSQPDLGGCGFTNLVPEGETLKKNRLKNHSKISGEDDAVGLSNKSLVRHGQGGGDHTRQEGILRKPSPDKTTFPPWGRCKPRLNFSKVSKKLGTGIIPNNVLDCILVGFLKENFSLKIFKFFQGVSFFLFSPIKVYSFTNTSFKGSYLKDIIFKRSYLNKDILD